MGSPSRNVQYHPPRLSEDRLNLPQPHSPSFAYTLLREIGNAPECNVLWKDALAELPHAFLTADESRGDSPDPRTAMQDEAVAACIRSLKNPPPELLAQWRDEGSDVPSLSQHVGRTKLILPCGTGKTRVSMRIVDELCSDGDLAVVLVPSIALIGQVRLAYLQGLRVAKRDTVTIAVCSDKTAGLVKSEEKAG